MAAIGPAFRGDLDTAEAAACAAETQAQAVGDPPGEIRALLAQAHVQSFRGFAVRAADLASRALELATADGTRQAFEGLPHAVLSLMLTQCDRIDEAGMVAEASRSVCEEFGMAGGLVWAHLAASYGLFIAGRWDDSCAAATAGLALAAETGTAWQADSLCVLALVDSRRGRPETAWEHLSHAEALVDAGEATYRPGWLAWARSVLEADRRRPIVALECLVPIWEQALGSGSVAEVRNYGPHLIRLAHASGRAELAEQVTASIEAQADANPAVGSLQASAQAMRGLLTEDADLLLDALELFRASPRRYEHARCAEAAASALLRAGPAAGRSRSRPRMPGYPERPRRWRGTRPSARRPPLGRAAAGRARPPRPSDQRVGRAH